MPRAGTLSKTRRWRTQSRRPCVCLFLYRVRETGRDYLRNPVNRIPCRRWQCRENMYINVSKM